MIPQSFENNPLCPQSPEEMLPHHYQGIARWASRKSPAHLREDVQSEVVADLWAKIVPGFDPDQGEGEDRFPRYVLFRARAAAVDFLRREEGESRKKKRLRHLSLEEACRGRQSMEAVSEEYEVVPESLQEMVTPETVLDVKDFLASLAPRKLEKALELGLQNSTSGNHIPLHKRGTTAHLLDNLPDGTSLPRSGQRSGEKHQVSLASRRDTIPDPRSPLFPWE